MIYLKLFGALLLWVGSGVVGAKSKDFWGVVGLMAVLVGEFIFWSIH